MPWHTVGTGASSQAAGKGCEPWQWEPAPSWSVFCPVFQVGVAGLWEGYYGYMCVLRWEWAPAGPLIHSCSNFSSSNTLQIWGQLRGSARDAAVKNGPKIFMWMFALWVFKVQVATKLNKIHYDCGIQQPRPRPASQFLEKLQGWRGASSHIT